MCKYPVPYKRTNLSFRDISYIVETLEVVESMCIINFFCISCIVYTFWLVIRILEIFEDKDDLYMFLKMSKGMRILINISLVF